MFLPRIISLLAVSVLIDVDANAELAWHYDHTEASLTVSGENYSLDLASRNATSIEQLLSFSTSSGPVTALGSLVVEAPCPQGSETCQYSIASANPESELLLLSAGNSLIEAHVTNLRLVSGTNTLPSMLQLTVFAHPESVYLKFELICNQRDWVIQYYNRGNYVYDAAPALSTCESQDVFSIDATFSVGAPIPPAMPLAQKTAQQNPLSVGNHYTVMTTAPLSRGYYLFGDETAWNLSLPFGFGSLQSTPINDDLAPFGCVDDTGQQRDDDESVYDRDGFGVMLAFGSPSQQQALVEHQQMPAALISDVAGSYQGFNAYSGRHEFGSHGNNQGTVATFEHRPGERFRIQQALPGASKGGTQPKQSGTPVAIAVQHSLNFDGQGLDCHGEVAGVRQLIDFHSEQVQAQAGDTFTLDIVPDHMPQNDVPEGHSSQYVNLLQPGSEGGLIIQTHNNGREANSLRLAGSSAEISITDWRRPYHQPLGAAGGPINKAGAAIKFLQYSDASGNPEFLQVVNTDIRSTGPGLGEVVMDVISTDGAIVGTISIASSAEKQMVSSVVPANRLWIAVDLTVVDEVTLGNQDDSLSFFSLVRRKPLVFRRYAVAHGSPDAVVVNDHPIPVAGPDIAPLGMPAGVMMYSHSNATKQGNSGFVIDSMNLVLDGQPRSPALWVKAEPDSSDDKYRWAKVVASGGTPSILRPGDQIQYRLVAFSAGDEDSTSQLLVDEFAALSDINVAGATDNYASGALVVDASVGNTFDVERGAGYLPIRFTGLQAGRVYDVSVHYQLSEVVQDLDQFAADANGELDVIMPMDRSSTGALDGVLVRESAARISLTLVDSD